MRLPPYPRARRPSRSLPASSLSLTRPPLASFPRIRSRSAGAAVLVFSTTDRASFDAIRRWRDKVEEQCGPIAMCICQNKVDLIDDAAVEPGEPESLARELGLKFYRVCVKDNFNVDAVFDYLVDQWSKVPEESGVGPAMDISEIAKGERRGVAGGTWQAAALGRARAGGGWQSAAEAAGVGNGRGPGTPGTPGRPGTRTGAGTGGESFKIVPSTRRTGGKKRLSARVASKCSS